MSVNTAESSPRPSPPAAALASGVQTHLANIQVLRAFAAMSVVWHHLETRFSADLGAPFLGFNGIAGVDVFFVISGFIMFHTTRDGTRSAMEFWLDRVIRIAPLYWIATAGVALMFWMGWSADGIRDMSAGDLVAAFAFFPDERADGYPYPVLDVGWTLVYEAWFYLLFGLTFFLRSQVAALLLLTVLFVAGAAARLAVPDLPFALEYWFRPIVLEFAAGGALALLWRSEKMRALTPAHSRLLGGLLLALGLAAILAAGWRIGWRLNQEWELRALAFGVPATLMVAGALLLEQGGASWRGRGVLLLGAASYAIYVFHQFIVGGLEMIAKTIFPRVLMLEDLVLIAAGLLLTAGLGVLIHLAVERPLTAWLKRRLRAGARRPG